MTTEWFVDRTRLRVRRAVWQEFGSTLCQHPQRTSCHHHWRSSDQHPRISLVQHWHHRMCSKRFREQVNRCQSQEESNIQYGIWMVYKKWAGNGPRTHGRCRQTHTKPPGSAAVGPLQCAGYVICNSLKRPAVPIGQWIQGVCGLLYCEDEEALLRAVQYVPSP
jgi:hypothetical protein